MGIALQRAEHVGVEFGGLSERCAAALGEDGGFSFLKNHVS